MSGESLSTKADKCGGNIETIDRWYGEISWLDINDAIESGLGSRSLRRPGTVLRGRTAYQSTPNSGAKPQTTKSQLALSHGPAASCAGMKCTHRV